MTQHPDEGTLHAYMDGELSRAEAEALEAHVAGCASCSAALAEARGLVAAASRVISALDAAPATVRAAAPGAGHSSEPASRVSRPLILRMPFARAAALLLLVGGSAFVVDRSGMFDGSARSRAVSTEADPLQLRELVIEPAPEAATSAAAAITPASPAPTDLSSATVGSPSRAVTRKEAPAPRVAANTVPRDGARPMDSRGAPGASDMLPSSRQQAAAAPASLKREESAEATRAPALAAAPPPPMAPLAARSADIRLSEVLVTDVSGAAGRVSRYRTREGTILTLTEEPLRTTFAEESDARRTAVGGTQRPAVAPMSAPVINSFRWSSPEQARTYTLSGPLPVAELEALSKRLGELERLP